MAVNLFSLRHSTRWPATLEVRRCMVGAAYPSKTKEAFAFKRENLKVRRQCQPCPLRIPFFSQRVLFFLRCNGRIMFSVLTIGPSRKNRNHSSTWATKHITKSTTPGVVLFITVCRGNPVLVLGVLGSRGTAPTLKERVRTLQGKPS